MRSAREAFSRKREPKSADCPSSAIDELLDLAGIEQEVVERRRRVGIGEVERDAVVRPDRLRVDAERVPEPCRERHRPGRVHASTERRQHAHAPVADLVAEALDDDRAIGGDDPGGRLLLAQIRDEISRRPDVEVVLAAQHGLRLGVGERDELARRAPDLLAELGRPPDPFALPERSDSRHAGRRGHEDSIARDVLDPPGRRPEQERLSLARFVHHLLVELADPPAVADEVDAEEAAVRDRAGIGHRKSPSAGAPAHDPRGAVPDDPRPELGELVRGVPAREHVEDVLELRAGEIGERIRATDERVQLVHRHFLVGTDRDDLLGKDVERVAGNPRLLDRALAHRARDDRALEQVGPELGEDPTPRDRVQVVPRSPHTLQPARDGLRALDLDHEVDGAHVDAELERGGGDETRDLPRFQELLDDDPLLARQRAVVGARDLLLRELVQPEREPLREPAVVHEDDRRAVLPDELDDRGIDRRPDRAAGLLDTRAQHHAVRERRH